MFIGIYSYVSRFLSFFTHSRRAAVTIKMRSRFITQQEKTTMAILTNQGRIGMAETIQLGTIYLAWAKGDGIWLHDDLPIPGVDDSLIDIVGFRRALQPQFCLPDSEGEIVLPDGKFSFTNSPSRYIYLKFHFDFDDASDETIRQLGIMTGTETEIQDSYITAADISPDKQGRLLLLENIVPLYRSPSVRETFEYVITF
jgi:hypothetical protein